MEVKYKKTLILFSALLFVVSSLCTASIRLHKKISFNVVSHLQEVFRQETTSAVANTKSNVSDTHKGNAAETSAVIPAKGSSVVTPSAGSMPPSSTSDAAISSNVTRQKVSFTFVGDILIEDYLADMIRQNGAGSVMSEVKGFFDLSDITAVNLESPISQRGEKAEDKQFTFRTRPEYVSVLTSAGIDVVSLANNHVLDYGQDAMLDTLSYLDRNGLKYAGAGSDLETASKPVYISKKGLKVAFIATSHVIPFTSWAAASGRPGVATTYDPTRAREEIRNARNLADLVVVYAHWGEEMDKEPVQYQKALARLYIDDGADIVIGSHPHVLQGLEYYKDKIIAYSLGNFVFTDALKDSMILAVEAEKGRISSVKVIPCQIRNYRPVPMTQQDELQQFFKKLELMSFEVDIANNGIVTKRQPK